MNQFIETTQATIATEVHFIGRGLHTGENVSLTVKPAEADSGIIFKRTDLSSNIPVIPARWYNVLDTQFGTTIGYDSVNQVRTIEHLMAALAGLAIDNVLIEIDGVEVPAMDGSAQSFSIMFERAGIKRQEATRSAIVIHQPIEYREGDSYAKILPSSMPRLMAKIDYDEQVIGEQSYSLTLTRDKYLRELAPARTFGCEAGVSHMRKKGLAQGASLRNSVYIRRGKVVNPGGLRYANEFVRHKMLDVVGDIALAGNLILGQIYINRPGHSFNNKLMYQLFSKVDHWSYDYIRNVSRPEQASDIA